MEARHCVSPLGVAGALGVWRSTVPVLSTCVLDVGRGSGGISTLEGCPWLLFVAKRFCSGRGLIAQCFWNG